MVIYPDYVIGGKAVALDLDVLVRGADGSVTRSGLGNRSDQLESLEREIHELVAARVRAAGYEFEEDPDLWRESDLDYYERSGQPHYLLTADLEIQPIYSSGGGEVAFAFHLEARLFAQFADGSLSGDRTRGILFV